MKQKKILIPGGKFSDWALVNAAHRLGLYVITSGTDASAPAHQFADKYVPADYSDKEAMLKLAKDENIDYMCSCANDYGMLSTAYVCEQLGLPGHDSYETTFKIHHKDTIKPIMNRLGMHTPYSLIFDDRQKAIDYIRTCGHKVILKPSDNVASHGVSTPETDADIVNSVNYAFDNTKAGRIIVEPFINGFFAPFTSMIIDQQVVAFFASCSVKYKEGERVAPEFPPYGKASGGMNPCPYMDEWAPGIIEDLNKLAADLKLVDGKFHGEFLITPEHEAYMVDVHRRMSGFTEPWPEWNWSVKGLKWEDWIVKAECGMDLSDFPKGIKQNVYSIHRNIYAPKNGILKKVIFDEYLTSHMWPKREEKNYVLHNMIVSDHFHQPVLDACMNEDATAARGNTMRFRFDTYEECEYNFNPDNSDEFYKHITFEYAE
ncbi:MAG: hypothetical protein IJJ48_07530 [Firmicutes bacterium]|nr:hypothetical protein [Bacillota bacterium]